MAALARLRTAAWRVKIRLRDAAISLSRFRLVAICFLFLPVVRALAALRRGPTRSLWSGAPILTLPVKARAERALGVDAKTLVYNTYFITQDFDYDLSRWMKSRFRAWIAHPWIFLWACARFDRFHFFCDYGLLPQFTYRHFNPWELAFYRWLGKELFFWTYGADVRTVKRTRELGEPNCCSECPSPGTYCICDDEQGRVNQANLSRHATAIFSMGDMIEYTPGSRNDLWFWPLDLGKDGGRRYRPSFPEPDDTRPIRVVHAPNHPYFKGTAHLERAVAALREEGLSLELVMVQGLPNEQALEIYRSADIVFDQCLIGFHGYFALEALAMGKPVMVFVRKSEYLLHPEECPLIDAPAATLESVLRDLVRNRARLREIGERGRRYIEKYYTVEAFSERLGSAYAAIHARSTLS